MQNKYNLPPRTFWRSDPN